MLLFLSLLILLPALAAAEEHTYRLGTKSDLKKFSSENFPPPSNADIAAGTLFVYSYLNSHLNAKDTTYTENLWLTITNPGTQLANVKVTSVFPGFNNQTVSVNGGSSQVIPITPVSIQTDYMDLMNGSIYTETKSIWVESDVPVKLVATNALTDGSSEDKFAVLPVCQLGTSYMGVLDESARTGSAQSTNVVTIIATQDGTNVRYLLGPIPIPLKKGQQLSVAINSPLSGVPITSNKPVAVISGAVCGFGYYNDAQLHCSHESLMLYPTTSFDTAYPFFKFQPEDYGEVMVYTTQDNTTVKLDSRALKPLDSDQFWVLGIQTSAYITANKPIYAVAVGSSNINDQGAPFFAHIPSPKLFTTGPIAFATAMTDDEAQNMKHFARVITSLNNIGYISVDNYTPNGLIYRRMGQSNYYFVDVQISPKTNHVVSATKDDVTFAVTVYGYGFLKSYAFNPGLNLPTTGTC